MKRDIIQEVIDTIETNITNPLTIEELADAVHYSRFYLHRLFEVCTGLSIMDYVRHRKMQYARAELHTPTLIIDLALKYGYQSERSFRRAFRNVFQGSPSSLRRTPYELPQKIHFSKRKGLPMIPYLSEVKEVTLPAYVAIGKSIVSKEPENDSIAFMLQFRLEHKINPLAEIGSDVPVSAEDQVQGRRGYVDYLIVDKETFDRIQDARISKIEVPTAKYLTLTIADPFKDPFERIPLGWQKLVQALEAGHQFRNELVFGGFEEVVKSLIHTQMNIYLAIK